MQGRKIQSPISLADAEIRKYSKDRDCLDLELKAWDNSTVYLKFSDVIGLCDFGGRDIGGFVQVEGSSQLLEAVLRRTFDRTSDMHGYHIFQGLDNDNQVTFEVVAKAVTVTV